MYQHLEIVSAQRVHGAAKEPDILEYASGQADEIYGGFFPRHFADSDHPAGDRVMESSGDLFSGDSRTQVFQNAA